MQNVHGWKSDFIYAIAGAAFLMLLVFSPDANPVRSAEASRQNEGGWAPIALGREVKHFGNLRVDERADGGPVIVLRGHTDSITDIAFSPDGAQLATASLDGTIQIWDALDGSQVRTIAGHSAGVRSIDFSPDGTLLASGSDDRTANIWSVADGSLERTLFPLMDSRVVEVEFSPDGSLLALGGNRCVVELRRVPSGILSRTIVPLGCAPGNGGSVEFWGLEFNQDGSRILTGDGRPCCGGGILQWWESREYTPPEVLKTGIVVVRDMALSPDGSEIAVALVGLSDFWLLDAINGEVKAVLSDHVFRVNDVEYSPDGSLLASASNDTGVGIWRAADGVLLRMLHEHRMQATAVAFSPDGLSLATGSNDGELLIWNVEEELGG
ncbi:MAG: WD40 repeat domain-containing protein [Chloroflexi bacterium]|nr:WD40 repeat domain-containing protein [Chloroflexota bacterium]